MRGPVATCGYNVCMAEIGVVGTLAERLARRLVRMPNGCLEWTGANDGGMGYGRIRHNGKLVCRAATMQRFFARKRIA